MANKSTGTQLEYTYEKLTRILQEATAKVKAGSANPKTRLYGAAAAHALDLIDASRDAKKPLDLTGRTEDNVFTALLQICHDMQQKGKSAGEIRTSLTKKLGFYELFAITNSMNCEGKTVEIVQQSGILAEPRLIIRTLPDASGAVHSFDVLAAAKAAVDKFVILDPKEDGAIMIGRLLPFYQRLEGELLKYLSE